MMRSISKALLRWQARGLTAISCEQCGKGFTPFSSAPPESWTDRSACPHCGQTVRFDLVLGAHNYRTSRRASSKGFDSRRFERRASGDSIRYDIPARHYGIWFGWLFAIFWNSITWTVVIAAVGSSIRSHRWAPLLGAAFGLPHMGIGIALLYTILRDHWTSCRVCCRVTLTPGMIRVKQSIFPWRAAAEIPTNQVEGLALVAARRTVQASGEIELRAGTHQFRFGANLAADEKQRLISELCGDLYPGEFCEATPDELAIPEGLAPIQPSDSHIKRVAEWVSEVRYEIGPSGRWDWALVILALFWNGFALFVTSLLIKSLFFGTGDIPSAAGPETPASAVVHAAPWPIFGLLLPFVLVGVVMVWRVLNVRFLRERIVLTPEEVRIDQDFLGLRTKVLPMHQIAGVDLVCNPSSRSGQRYMHLEFDAAGKRHRFGTTLAEADQQWLLYDIRAFLKAQESKTHL